MSHGRRGPSGSSAMVDSPPGDITWHIRLFFPSRNGHRGYNPSYAQIPCPSSSSPSHLNIRKPSIGRYHFVWDRIQVSIKTSNTCNAFIAGTVGVKFSQLVLAKYTYLVAITKIHSSLLPRYILCDWIWRKLWASVDRENASILLWTPFLAII